MNTIAATRHPGRARPAGGPIRDLLNASTSRDGKWIPAQGRDDVEEHRYDRECGPAINKGKSLTLNLSKGEAVEASTMLRQAQHEVLETEK